MKNKREIVFILVGVAFLLFVLVSMGVFRNLGQQVAQEFYVNAKGEKWTLPDGKYEFTVSASGYPRFLGGVIDPVKVKVGDTQTMTVRVASPVPIESVVAEIQTDTKTQEIALTLVENKALSGEYFENQPYLIDDSGELIINRANSSYAEKAIKQLVASAEAQSLVEYVFEGEWVVNDTHTKLYHTKFTATDEDGNADELILAWSDPVCNFLTDVDGTGLLQGDCSVTNGVEGFDGANLSLNGHQVTLSGTSSLIWNGDAEGNRSLIIGGGSISIGNGTQVKEALLWYTDLDADTFTADLGTIHYEDCSLPPCPQRVRVKDSPSRPWFTPALANGLDCLDDPTIGDFKAVDVHPQLPGEEKYFEDFYNAGVTNPQSYDYDCSGAATGGWGNNVPTDITSTTLVYFDIISGGDDQGGGKQLCNTGATIEDFSSYCGTLSPSTFIRCDVGLITGGGVGSPEIFPPDLENGWMYGTCTECIGVSVAGFCH